MSNYTTNPIIGILLAAGSSARYGGNKLIQPLTDDKPIAVQAAENLLMAIPNAIAVVRPTDRDLKQHLRHLPIRLIDNPHHLDGMSRSIVCGVRASPHASGWIIALADMPYIPAPVIEQVAAALLSGADIVVPVYQGQRGHPVGFSMMMQDKLLQLRGDQGARRILETYAALVRKIEVNSPEILIDIDQRPDPALL